MTKAPLFKNGDRVNKIGGRYGGPGTVVGVTDELDDDGYRLYDVAMKVEGGYGTFVHVFPASVLVAALTAPEAKSEVAVKVLEWEWPNEYGLICRAKTSIGTYSISDNEDSSGGSLLCYLHLTEEADSTRWAIEIFHGYAELDEVQAAAQSDYATRVLSALVIEP